MGKSKSAINKYYDLIIKQFEQIVEEYCKSKEIEVSLENALNYNFQVGVCNDFFKFLYTAPKIYLANHNSFLKFRKKLDIDMMNEILTDSEIRELQVFLVGRPAFVELLKEHMKENFYNFFVN